MFSFMIIFLNILNAFCIFKVHIYIFMKCICFIMTIKGSMLIVYIYLKVDISGK